MGVTNTENAVNADRRRAFKGSRDAHGLRGVIRHVCLIVSLLALTTFLLVGAYQGGRPITLSVGGPHETPFVRNFHPRAVAADDGTRYRWSDATSFIILPGIGGGRERRLTLRLRSGRPAGATQPVTILVNGVRVGQTDIGPTWQDVAFDVRGPAAMSHGVAVELRTPIDRLPTSDGQLVGVQVASLTLTTIDSGRIVPAWGTLAQALFATLAIYGIALRALDFIGWCGTRRPWLAWLSAVAGAVGLSVLFVVARPYLAVSLPILLAILVGVVVALMLPPLLQWLGARLHLGTTATEAAALCGIVALALVAKLGGLLYPDTQVVDLAWHVRWERTLLNGDFGALYFPSALSSGPGIWGEGVLIPKSPLFYLAMAPFTLLPFSLGTVLKLVAGSMELLVIFLPYVILKRIGMGAAGVVAALLYTVTPMSYLILSYGSYPTLFAQFLTLLTFAVVVLAKERWTRPGIIAVFVALLALSLVAYPVVAIFNVCVLGAIGAWWWRHPPDTATRRTTPLILLGMLTAGIVAFVGYYMQYVAVVLHSVHTLTGETAQRRGYLDGGVAGIPAHLLAVIANTIDVGHLYVLLPLAGTGVVLLRRSGGGEMRRTWQFLWLWLLILPVFTLVDAYIDLLLKQLFYTMVPVAIFAGVAIVWLWQHGRYARVVAVLCCVAIAAQAWWMWWQRIALAGQ
jgi:hypothetical protein